MRPNINNPYGYKVCYKEKFHKYYVRQFKTRSYKQAVKVKQDYVKENNPLLKKPVWHIMPITRAEVLKGIWREVPF